MSLVLPTRHSMLPGGFDDRRDEYDSALLAVRGRSLTLWVGVLVPTRTSSETNWRFLGTVGRITSTELIVMMIVAIVIIIVGVRVTQDVVQQIGLGNGGSDGLQRDF